MTRSTSRLLAGMVLFLSVFLLGFSSPRVLPPAAAAPFSRLVDLINTSGRLGPTLRATGVAIEPSQARLSLQSAEQGPVTVVLASPSFFDTRVRSRWFSLSASPDKLTETDLQSLAALIDEVFQSDPFVTARGNDESSLDPRSSDESSFERRRQDFIRRASMEKAVLGRGHVVAIVVLLIAATAVTAWQLLKAVAQPPDT